MANEQSKTAPQRNFKDAGDLENRKSRD